jgi:hypothetical protein
MIAFGLIGSVLDTVTFVTLPLGFGANEALFRSGWFIESTITELAVMLVLRTNRRFYRSRPGRALLLSSIAIITIALPYSPPATPLGLTTVPAQILGALVGLPASTSSPTNWQDADSHPPIEGEVTYDCSRCWSGPTGGAAVTPNRSSSTRLTPARSGVVGAKGAEVAGGDDGSG